jgi:sulfonate transport system permease protein
MDTVEPVNTKRCLELAINCFLFVGVPLLLLISWQAMGDRERLNLSIMPTPKMIWGTFVVYINNGLLWEHFIVSLRRVLFGFGIGTGTGLILGILLGFFKKFERATTVVLSIIRPIPMIGMVPLFILWFGIGEKSKVLVIAVGTLWPILLNTENGIRNTDIKLLEVAKILKKDKFTVLSQIIFPSMIPAIVTGVRLGLSNAWRGVVSAEMLGASKGIGYMISYAREMSRPDLMFVGLLIIGIVGILIDILLFRFQRRLVRWA